MRVDCRARSVEQVINDVTQATLNIQKVKVKVPAADSFWTGARLVRRQLPGIIIVFLLQ